MAGPHHEPSRRAFLRGLAAIAAAPLPMAACSRAEPEESAGSQAAAPAPAPAPARGPILAALPDREPWLRVRIARHRDPFACVRFGAAGGWICVRQAEDDPIALRGPVTLARRAGHFVAIDARGALPMLDPQRSIIVASADDPRAAGYVDGGPTIASSSLLIDGELWPGFVQCHPTAGDGDGDASTDGFDLVNHVAVETYLPGVLVRELYRHWHPETFAAQAIAARSFAAAEAAYFRNTRHFDVTATQASQMYGPLSGQSPHARSHDAAHATRGILLSWEGGIVPGYYSSCCGGLTASAQDAIGEHPINGVPPLRGAAGEDPCSEARLYRWRVERDPRDLLARIHAWARLRGMREIASLGTIAAITVAEVGPTGRPRTYALEDTSRTVAFMPAERLRLAANHAAGALGPPRRSLFSGFVTATTATTTTGDIRFDGRGHGHGAGLCQHGAEALARAGTTSTGILARYYPGAVLSRAYA